MTQRSAQFKIHIELNSIVKLSFLIGKLPRLLKISEDSVSCDILGKYLIFGKK